MTVFVLGSVNIDHVHRVPHFPAAGETLADTGYASGLGGKGANQAIAAARAGARVVFAGAVGADGAWTREALAAEGIEVSHLATAGAATGHAVIFVTPEGENSIVIHGGANRAVTRTTVDAALAAARPGDWWLTQNETALVAESMAAARAAGLRTVHAAAPFGPEDAAAVLPQTDLLAVNEGEAAALAAHLGCAIGDIPVAALLVTLGAAGARFRVPPAWPAVEGAPAGARAAGAVETLVPAIPVTPVDTTGAGDAFLGTFLAALDGGLGPEASLLRGAAAGALACTRPGAADALPTAAEIDALLAERAP